MQPMGPMTHLFSDARGTVQSFSNSVKPLMHDLIVILQAFLQQK